VVGQTRQRRPFATYVFNFLTFYLTSLFCLGLTHSAPFDVAPSCAFARHNCATTPAKRPLDFSSMSHVASKNQVLASTHVVLSMASSRLKPVTSPFLPGIQRLPYPRRRVRYSKCSRHSEELLRSLKAVAPAFRLSGCCVSVVSRVNIRWVSVSIAGLFVCLFLCCRSL